MLTYQDLLATEQTDDKRLDFVRRAINQHKSTWVYQTFRTAQTYDRQQNETIIKYQKLLYTLSGRTVADTWSPNYKLCSNFYNRFTVQENQYLLGNGVSFGEESTKKRLGVDFDQRIVEIGKDALDGGVAFGFWNLDHLEVFSVGEFVPLYDEDNSSLRSGVRFWQIDDTKPLRATLYEEDGYTEMEWKDGKGSILREKRPYILRTRTTAIDGTEIYKGENYPTFPIVPMWGNPAHQSEIVGLRENIDAYDLIKSGFADTVDESSEIYWIVQNAGGMDEVDLRKFLNSIKRAHAAVVDEDGAKAEAHTLDIPYAAREAILQRLRNDMYEDYMALDVKTIAAGATTATQIKAAYEPINAKADQYEACVTEFIQGILAVAGIEDTPTYTRSMISNAQEQIQMVISAANYLPEEYVTRKILTILGDTDRAEEVIAEMQADERERFAMSGSGVVEQVTNGTEGTKSTGE